MEYISHKGARLTWKRPSPAVFELYDEQDNVIGQLRFAGFLVTRVDLKDGSWECVSDGFTGAFLVRDPGKEEPIARFVPELIFPFGRRQAGTLELNSGAVYQWMTQGMFTNEYQWQGIAGAPLMSVKNPWFPLFFPWVGIITPIAESFLDPNWALLLAVGWNCSVHETSRNAMSL